MFVVTVVGVVVVVVILIAHTESDQLARLCF